MPKQITYCLPNTIFLKKIRLRMLLSLEVKLFDFANLVRVLKCLNLFIFLFRVSFDEFFTLIIRHRRYLGF